MQINIPEVRAGPKKLWAPAASAGLQMLLVFQKPLGSYFLFQQHCLSLQGVRAKSQQEQEQDQGQEREWEWSRGIVIWPELGNGLAKQVGDAVTPVRASRASPFHTQTEEASLI